MHVLETALHKLGEELLAINLELTAILMLPMAPKNLGAFFVSFPSAKN